MGSGKYKKLIKELETNFLKYTIVITLFMGGIIWVAVYQINKQQANTYKNSITAKITHSLKFAQENIINNLSTDLERLLFNQKITKYFYKKNRIKLYLATEDSLNFMLQNNSYIRSLQFHNPDGTSFLRMMNSSKYSDNIAANRPMLQEVHKNHKKLVGFEQGKDLTLLKVVKPIFYNDKYIGALEISMDPQYFLHYIKNNTTANGFLFINKDRAKPFIDIFDFELNGKVIESFVEKDKLDMLQKIPKNYTFNKNITFQSNYKTYFLSTFEVTDFKNNSLGKFIFLTDITKFEKDIEGKQLLLFIGLFSILVLLFLSTKKYIKHFEQRINNFFSTLLENEKNEKNYLQAVENSSSKLSLTRTKEKYITINKTALEFLGYKSLEEFEKHHNYICEFFIKKEGYLQENMGSVYWLEYILQNPTISHKVILQKNNQNYIFLAHVESFLFQNETRYLITLTDITELENLQQEFQYIIQRNQFAEKGANIALWDWNLQNDTVFYSDIWKSLLGYKTEEIHNTLEEWHQRIHPEDIDKVIVDLDSHFDGKTQYFINHHRLLHKNGTYIHVISRAQAIYKNDVPVRMVGIYTDITKEQQAIDKIKEQEELMIAQSRHAAMGEMISMIAHQWRQPIASIAMGVNNIIVDIELDSLETDELRELCDEILDQTQYLSTTIDDFRNFFKSDKTKVTISIESVIQDAIKLMEKSLANSNIKFQTEYFHTEEIATLPNEILQILLNLIKNAKEVLVQKAIEDGYIKIYTTEDEKYVYIDVEDNGEGIDKKYITKIFDPYFTTKEEFNGTGLGLYMSKTVAQKHLEGDLSVKNSLQGAIFTLKIKKQTFSNH